jgi:Ca-activated chloride channel family protein
MGWIMRVWALVTAAVLLGISSASGAWAEEVGGPVDLELVLAVDASGSISTGALEFQLRGHAAAFRDPQVADALTVGGARAIAVTLVQWAGPNTLETVVPWTRIGDAADAKRFADSIADMTRPPRDGSTAMGSAIDRAVDLFDGSGFTAPRRVIDICSNGFSNAGVDVSGARDRAVKHGVTINALAILDEYDWLEDYYIESVIGGPFAFVRTAESRESFANAILRKLIEEIAGVPGGGAEEGTRLATVR